MKVGKSKNKGITLIALVITIIVLLILAGVTIATLTGDNGILTQASRAKQETETAEDIEKIRLAITEAQIGGNGYQKLDENNLQKAIDSQFGIEKVFVDDDKDGIFTVGFIDSNREYYIKDGELLDKDPRLLINQENLQLGQYVNYHDIYSNNTEDSDLTWRIIDTGNLNNHTGTVKIVSYGKSIQYAYTYDENYTAEDAVNDLTNYEKFKNVQFEGGIKGELFYDIEGKYAENARAFTVQDANYTRGYTIENSNSYDNCFDNELIYVEKTRYWFATASSVWSLRYKEENGDIKPSTSATLPIRIVITLKDNVKGKFDEDLNMWVLE